VVVEQLIERHAKSSAPQAVPGGQPASAQEGTLLDWIQLPPAATTLPQSPQFKGSELRSTQSWPQQSPAVPLGRPQPYLTFAREQSTGGSHSPTPTTSGPALQPRRAQMAPVLQTTPHPPQSLVSSSMQFPLQQKSPPAQGRLSGSPVQLPTLHRVSKDPTSNSKGGGQARLPPSGKVQNPL